MAEAVDPIKVQTIVRLGFKRVEHFCKVTAMMFKSYVPQYYRQISGVEGEEPLGLVFHVIRSFVPNLVMDTPVTNVTTPYLAHKAYAELLGLGLDSVARDIKLKDELRKWITNAMFGWGIMQVGLAASGELLQHDDVMIDNGQVYAKNVSIDNFGFDPACTDIREANSMWHRTTVPRQLLLDTDGYDHDIVKALPSSPTNHAQKLADFTRTPEAKGAMTRLQDEVDVVEMYVPEAEAIITMGDPTQTIQPRYIKVADYNGVKEGPYVFLSFSQPVDQNPFPVAPVSVWYDLAKAANEVFNKELEQIRQQKDIILYNPAQSDEVDDIQESKTGDKVPSTDPKGINAVSIGGQNPKNDAALATIQFWLNYMSGNPDFISANPGPSGGRGKETATKTMTMQGNASVGLEDMRGMVYDGTSEIQRRVAWYLHTDPFIDLPLTKRSTGGEQVQLTLTPEQRQGDFLKFTFKIVARSMTPMDPMVRSKRIELFCGTIMPNAANTAMILAQVGQQFNITKYLTIVAFEMGIQDIVEDIFNDPEWQQKMQMMAQMGPQDPGKANTPGAGIQQNRGSPMVRPTATPQQDVNAQVQAGANQGQSLNQGLV